MAGAASRGRRRAPAGRGSRGALAGPWRDSKSGAPGCGKSTPCCSGFRDSSPSSSRWECERSRRPGFTAFHVVLRSDQREVLPGLVRALEQLLDGACETVTRELPGGETALLVLVPASEAARVERLLADTRVQEVPAPTGYGPGLVEALPRMRERAAAIPSELEAIGAERAELLARHAPELRRALAAVRDQLAQLEALPLTAVTSHVFVLDGWLPTGTEDRLSRALAGACGGEVVVETLDTAGWQGEEVPVVLRNPRLFRPFELLTGMVPLPRYGTIDPDAVRRGHIPHVLWPDAG